MVTPELHIALKQLRSRQKRYKLYADYYAGDHALAFATDKFKSIFGELFDAFADNLCPAIVDAVADRLSLTGFGVEEGAKRAGKDAWQIWQANRMDRRAGEVHLEALTAGDAYVIVWPGKDGQPQLWPNKAHLVTVRYDPEHPGVMTWAAKGWKGDDGRQYLTLYYPDRIEKYVSAAKGALADATLAGYERRRIAGEAWPLRNPWGVVPVFHFANNAPIGGAGVSELKQAKPIQDALNKSVADMLVAMEFVALPQRWATGLEVEIDKQTGKPIPPFQPGVDRVWSVADAAVKFGEFQQANLEQFLKVQDSFRLELARVSGTPVHHMMLITDPPSGEALKTLEARFTKKCRDRQVAFGNTWEDVLALALRMRNAKPARLGTQWEDPAPRSEREAVEVQELKQKIGVSRRQSLKELSYPEETINEMLGEQPAQPVAPGDDEE